VKKSQIRKIILKKRNNLNFKNKKFNFGNLLKLLNYKSKNKKIGLYYPIGSEVSTIELIKYLRKKKYIISLPVLEKNFVMSFYEWNNKSPLKINNYGIPEPLKLKKIIPSILIIPIVAFDTKLNRLGYGGGFYDRFINKTEKTKKILKIGLALSCQKINKVPINKYDKKMNYIFTEMKVYK
jgi:5-formyltetrahydrofolate cyclo-ligase